MTYLEENYVTGSSATSTACCHARFTVPNPEEHAKKNTKEFGKMSQMFCKLAVSDNTDSHAESQPLFKYPYISAAGGVFPSWDRYLSLFTASGFFIPLTGASFYFFTSNNSDK